jgi:uncharacterized protein YgiM (DUF1202 family)
MRTHRLISILIALLVLGSTLLAPLTAAAQAEAAACVPSGAIKTVNAFTGLRLRSAPGLASPLVTFLWNQEHVKVVGCDVWADAILWSQVEVNRFGVKTTGWAAAAYLSSYVGYTEPRDEYTGSSGCKITTDALRLRAAPGLKAKVLRVVPYGTILPFTSTPDVTVDGYVWQELTMNGTIVYGARMFMECFSDPA